MRLKKMPSGENHYAWRGNKVGYRALHNYMEKHKPKPTRCEICLRKVPLDLACLSEKYTRDPNDYVWVCRHCHHILDHRSENLGQYSQKKEKGEGLNEI